ncbi:membrane protein [Sphaerisporangium krabiense]|uniref:Putative membrane protein n=1 Tax=Sphaerisporangium krabiense TaxID=763782 RepID=A0A7W9DUI7_9ACTN|nr:anthrone oxygenase family protein [Sphaerisporangium krabiense]MBB5631763.1 putative membrane protein [Sphaerisporangium krabiense]GII60598.1 membrane protein [Sphaerisporangium krabiense]
MEAFRQAALIAATVTTGLVAGLFYAYACSVMPALRRTDDRTFILVMQRINVAILNGWFAAGFAGAPLLTAAALALHLDGEHRGALPWIVAALLAYGVMLAVTFGVNIPLNNELDAAGEPDGIADPAAVRARFEARWVRWNVVRALASTAALGLLAWALLMHGTAGAS